MNDFGLVQLIWIKRLVSETTRINTLIECNSLSKKDLNRYKSVISAIDDFCAFVINSQNWRDVKNISSIVDEVEIYLVMMRLISDSKIRSLKINHLM